MPNTRAQDKAQGPDADARSARERAVDDFLDAAETDFGPVPEEVLAEVRAQWPE
ncbi:MAG: hypothetical protein ACRDXE_02685 [Acidimicrobiales bacterium]